MDGYQATTYGTRIAGVYDELHPSTPAVDTAAAFLADAAGAGRVLELAIGTGRVALPLRDRGVPVEGVDISPEMVERLRAKQGGADIPITIGDFGDVPVDGSY